MSELPSVSIQERKTLSAKVAQEKPQFIRDEVTSFLDTHYARGADYWRLQTMEGTAITPGIMRPDTRVVVMIPAHYSEMNLDRTLHQYARQDLLQPVIPGKMPGPAFELAVLVNGRKGEVPDLTKNSGL